MFNALHFYEPIANKKLFLRLADLFQEEFLSTDTFLKVILLKRCFSKPSFLPLELYLVLVLTNMVPFHGAFSFRKKRYSFLSAQARQFFLNKVHFSVNTYIVRTPVLNQPTPLGLYWMVLTGKMAEILTGGSENVGYIQLKS